MEEKLYQWKKIKETEPHRSGHLIDDKCNIIIKKGCMTLKIVAINCWVFQQGEMNLHFLTPYPTINCRWTKDGLKYQRQ